MVHIHTYDDSWKCTICGKVLDVAIDLETQKVHVAGFMRKAKYYHDRLSSHEPSRG